jgi:pimeloyl-ACP methyl ester carboxylesterase
VEAQQRPVVLVGHSYGGAVITGATAGNAKIKALVYIAAFAQQERGGEATNRKSSIQASVQGTVPIGDAPIATAQLASMTGTLTRCPSAPPAL